jgi:nitronate monooxygenase
MSSATSVREARWLADRGCDVIIAQGAEAGGHRGNFLERDMSTQLGTLALTPQVVDAVDVPVIAAGGIADGRGIAAAFALGAAGVQIGTAFLFTREATISPLHHAAISGETATSTAITNVFSGRPARCVLNRAVRELGPMHDESPEFPLGFAAMAPLRAEAEGRGCRDFSAHYCGQSAPLSRGGPVGAADLTQWLADDARRILGGMA